MNREVNVRFCGSRRVQPPPATRPTIRQIFRKSFTFGVSPPVDVLFACTASCQAAGLTVTLMVFAPAFEAMTNSGASGAETTCPPVTLTW
jgi:hypothetical protein